jgi:hypothetical protein
MNIAPAVYAPSNNDAFITPQRRSLARLTANAIPTTTRPGPIPGAGEPIDPGAQALIDSILNRVQNREVGADGITRIGMVQLRNQSHSGQGEFGSFQKRFAELLSRAGHDSHIEVTADPDAKVQYQFQGTAYLGTTEGFDVWELYLSLSPATQNWTVWEARGAVRVLRQPRVGQQQIFWNPPK